MADIHPGILLLFGIGVLGGALGAWFFQKIRFPQVVGYIVFGIVIGQSGLKLIQPVDIEHLGAFTWFALGVIGFLVGGELRGETFRKYGKQFCAILFGEGLAACVLVGGLVTGVVYWVTKNWAVSAATGIVFGAIASATDPASTVEVLWEYRAKGVLTSTIIAVIALDDALAMALYGIGTSCAEMLVGNGSSIWFELRKIGLDLFGSILVGGIGGLVMLAFLTHVHQKRERMLAIAVGMLLVVIGVSNTLGLDVILVTMTMGVLLVNAAPIKSDELFKVVKSFSGPIYVMFFVLVGARLGFTNMPGWLWAIVIVYVLGRSVGKMAGCYYGARMSGACDVVKKYTGLGIFAQGGVAIGLSIMASQHMKDIMITSDLSLGDTIVFGVTTTTMIVQLLGPSLVKLSVRLADEMNRNVTEEDVIERLGVADVLDREIEPLSVVDNINDVLGRFANTDSTALPVVAKNGSLAGILTLTQLKDILADSDCWRWMVVADVVDAHYDSARLDQSLAEAMRLMDDKKLEQMPVICSESDTKPAGILDLRSIRRKIEQEMIKIQTKA